LLHIHDLTNALLADLQRKKMKKENITKHFQNNHVEIRNIAEEKSVHPTSNDLDK